MHSDCVIIGGGLIGMLTARELLRSGLRVTILEKGQVGRESTWAGGGILSPLYPWRYPDSITRLASWGQQHYQSLCEELTQESGIDPQWTQTGLLCIDIQNEMDVAVAWAKQHSVKAEQLDAQQLAQNFPFTPLSATHSCWFPLIAQVRNPRFAKALRGAVLHYGGVIIEDSAVTAISQADGKVVAVETSIQSFPTNKLLLAAGSWSRSLLQPLGVNIDVEPVRGQMLLFKAEPGVVPTMLLYRDRYLIPRRDGRVLAGSTLEYVGFDKTTTQSARQDLQAAALEMCPALADFPIEQHWAGLRPGSSTGVPLISALPQMEGLYVNTGHFRNGVILGAASCRLMADIMLQRQPILDPAPYAIVK